MSLHYYGKSKEGISKWGGGWSGIPTWFMVLFYTLNMVLGIAGLWVLAKGADRVRAEAFPIRNKLVGSRTGCET